MLKLEDLGIWERALVLTHHATAGSYLAALACANALKSSRTPLLIELSPINRRLFEEFLERRSLSFEKISISTDLHNEFSFPTIIYAVGYDLRQHMELLRKKQHDITLVVTHVGSFIGNILRARAFSLRKIEEDIFLLEEKRGGDKLYLEMNNMEVKLVERKENKMAFEGLRAIEDSMFEYGSLRTKDAIFILQGRLKIEKEEARRILDELVRMGKIKIIHGMIELG
ncbi:MAG: hypothetical protein QXO53_04480 [Fervidicoccaceae archaeon]